MVLPTFRPEKALNINLNGFADYIAELEKVSDISINSVDDVIAALEKRADYFDEIGCRVSDHSFDYVPFSSASDDAVEAAFQKAMNGQRVSREETDAYKTKVLLALGEKYYNLGWAMEIHIGAMRNNNTAMFNKKGC